MTAAQLDDAEGHALVAAIHKRKELAMSEPVEPAVCEAEERNLRAAFAIEQMMGSWQLDLGKLKRILTGTEECHHDQAAT